MIKVAPARDLHQRIHLHLCYSFCSSNLKGIITSPSPEISSSSLPLAAATAPCNTTFDAISTPTRDLVGLSPWWSRLCRSLSLGWRDWWRRSSRDVSFEYGVVVLKICSKFMLVEEPSAHIQKPYLLSSFNQTSTLKGMTEWKKHFFLSCNDYFLA